MYWTSSRPSSRAIAKFLNDISGGDEVEPGAINVSPEWLDVVWDSITGSAGRFVADSLETPYKVLTGETVERQEIPFVRRLAGQKPEFADSQMYHERLKEVLYAQEQIKNYRSNPEKLRSIRADKGDLLRMGGMAKLSENRLRLLRKRLDAAKTDEVKNRIQENIDKVYVRFNTRYRDVVLQ